MSKCPEAQWCEYCTPDEPNGTEQDRLAKAWDEGYAEGIIHMGMSIEDHAKQVNPYRSDAGDEFQNPED